nr:DUF2971 domain-containing protein [Clostridioides sp.]
MKKKIINLKNSYGIASFSENNNSILMWSHYANNHSGLCFEYDSLELDPFVNTKGRINLIPVSYDNNILKYNTEDIKYMNDSNKIQSFVYKKSLDWEY